VKAYLEYVYREARQRFDAGLSAADAARDIDLGPFADLGDSERIAVNVASAYREFDPAVPRADVATLFSEMAALKRR
jgi:hypothetical protein